MTAEDHIHGALLLALAALAGVVVLSRDPASAPAPVVPKSSTAPHAVDLDRAELDAAITPLRAFVQLGLQQARTPVELGLGLQGLGRAALSAGAERVLSRIGETLPSSEGAPESTAVAALGTLLEAGFSLDERLSLAGSTATLRELVTAALAEAPKDTAGPDPWRLDLLTFATMAGLGDHAERLGAETHACLSHLELAYRDLGSRGSQAEAALIERETRHWQQTGDLEPRSRLLHASGAVFRAIAVLGADDLDVRARRHLAALSAHYHLERAVYPHLLGLSTDVSRRESIHIVALERLGRLEQALYQAHLNMRPTAGAEPSPALARLMRQVARDLLEHWSLLRTNGAFAAAPDGTGALREAALRAAVHALRGLRTARIAA